MKGSVLQLDLDGQEPSPPIAPAAAPSRTLTAVLYIDADNQPPQSAAALVAVFRDDLAVPTLRAVIAGNDSGRQIQLWAEELAVAAPGIASVAIHVPSRRDAADLALIMALGANLADHRHAGDLVVVVSRDDLLVGAAEHAKAQGCRAFAAYVDSDPPCCRSSRVSTLLLPGAARVRPPAPPARRLISTLPSLARRPAAPPPTSPAAPPAPPGPAPDPSALLAKLRELCTPRPEGGYGAGSVGQALQRLGLDEKARRHFLANTPGIQVEGAAPDKVYRF